jgi:two-component system, OmpR family, response regulator AdeR
MARVLVVDDNAGIRKLLSAVLHQAFHEPVLAADGQEALQVYRQLKPALVIVDLFLPKLDGIKTITALRRESTTVKIIAISAGPRAGGLGGPLARESDPLEEAKRAGADITLSKPFDAAVIRGAVQDVLARTGSDELREATP